MTETERNNIRNRLKEHLAAINTFLAGVQVDTLGLTVKLLFKVLEEQLGGTKEDDIRAFVDNPQKMQDLLKVVRTDNVTLDTELDKDSDIIRDKLKEAATDENLVSSGTSWPASITRPLSTTTTASNSVDQSSLIGPTKPKSTEYDPWSIDWFKRGGYQFLTPIEPSSDWGFVLKDPVMRYSEDDDWLCTLPEGWSMLRTLIERGGQKQEAMYYTFNNLSPLPENKPRTTRAYFLKSPFSYDGMKTEFDVVGDSGLKIYPAPRFHLKYPRAYKKSKVPMYGLG